MSDKMLDAKVIKKTQDSLGKIIKKPPMTDKLLSKPPFKFLHDITTSVIKTTGFMKGLFTEEEMNSDNVKDKESKIVFLQKAIDMVSLVTGKPIAAKPSKIVAGHDADRTNEFLQAIAESINKKIDNDDYVRRVLRPDDAAPVAKKEKESKSKDKESSSKDDSKRSRDRSDRHEESSEKDRSDRHKSRDSKERHRDRSKENEDQNAERESKHRDKDREERHKSRENGEKGSREKSRDKDKEKSREKKDRGDDESRGDRKDRDKKDDDRRKEDDKSRGDRKDKKEEDRRDKKEKEKRDESEEADAGDQRLQRPTSAKGSRRRHGKDDEQKRDMDEEPKLSASRKAPARPSSARPAPPKPRNDHSAEDALIPGMRRPNVIVDKQGDSDDDDDAFITKEEDLPAAPEPMSLRRTEHNPEEDGDHGGLVKKILETKKELESNQKPGRTEIDRSQAMSDASRRKERDMVQKDIDRLRSSIQTLTRSVNPLGKILDFLQEDLDSMQKELDVYVQENKENTIVLQREQSLTDSSIGPLRAQLLELDSNISDELDKIAAVKATIGHNDVKVSKLLATVASNS